MLTTFQSHFGVKGNFLKDPDNLKMSHQKFENAAYTMKNKVSKRDTLDHPSCLYQVKKTLTDDELKEVYSLFKQATVGDINIEKPNMTDVK